MKQHVWQNHITNEWHPSVGEISKMPYNKICPIRKYTVCEVAHTCCLLSGCSCFPSSSAGIEDNATLEFRYLAVISVVKYRFFFTIKDILLVWTNGPLSYNANTSNSLFVDWTLFWTFAHMAESRHLHCLGSHKGSSPPSCLLQDALFKSLFRSKKQKRRTKTAATLFSFSALFHKMTLASSTQVIKLLFVSQNCADYWNKLRERTSSTHQCFTCPGIIAAAVYLDVDVFTARAAQWTNSRLSEDEKLTHPCVAC